MVDPFASGPVATTLAWLAVAGTFSFVAVSLVGFILAKNHIARAFKIWLVLCLAFLAPARYIFFQVIAAETFAVQSFSAFFSTFVLGLYIPFIFGVLYLIGIGIPLGVTFLVLGDEKKREARHYVGASVVLPLACLLASWLFYLALPLAARSVRWLPAEHVVRATNGPAAVVFDHIAAPFAPLTLPRYFELTPRDAKALRRCHVAAVYLSSNEEVRFLAQAYPIVYEEVTSD